MTQHTHNAQDIDRAIRLGVWYADYTPADLYVMSKAQEADKRNAGRFTVAICALTFLAMCAYLWLGVL